MPRSDITYMSVCVVSGISKAKSQKVSWADTTCCMGGPVTAQITQCAQQYAPRAHSAVHGVQILPRPLCRRVVGWQRIQ